MKIPPFYETARDVSMFDLSPNGLPPPDAESHFPSTLMERFGRQAEQVDLPTGSPTPDALR
jgi:hypothetical protein